LPNHLKLWGLVFVLALGTLPMSSFAQQNLPDLVVSRIWIGDKSKPIVPRAGEPFYLCATVKNIGNAQAEGYYVQPYFGGGPLAPGGPGKIEAGGAQDWSCGPVTVGPGIYEVRWVVNPDRRVGEASYGNNEILMIVVIEASSPVEALLQPLGGFIGLVAIVSVVLIVLVVSIILRRYVKKRKRAIPSSPETTGRRSRIGL